MVTPTRHAKPLLFLALFNSIVGFSILFPILAPLSRSLGLNEVEVGWLATSYSLAQFLASSYFGRLSERIGRKPVIQIGVAGFAISFAAFGWVAHLGQQGVFGHTALMTLLLMSRILGGTLSSATLPAAQAYIADITDRRDRTAGMAIVGAAFGLGIICGPVIGAVLSRYGMLVPVWVSTGVAVVNGIFIALRLPDTQRRTAEKSQHFEGVVRRTSAILGVAFATVLASVAMEQSIAFLYQDTLHLSPATTASTVGMALGVYGVAAVVSQGFAARKLKWSPLQVTRLGMLLAIVGFAGLIVAKSFAALTASMAVQGFGYGLSMPALSSLLSLSVGDNEQGEIAGLNSSTQALARTAGPLLGTALYRMNGRFPYIFSVVLLAIALAVTLLGALKGRDGMTSHAR